MDLVEQESKELTIIQEYLPRQLAPEEIDQINITLGDLKRWRDEEIGRLASTLWGEPGKDTFRRSLGRGKLLGGTSLREVLEAEGLIPDFSGPWECMHRHSDDMDIYFVVGSGSADCVFRSGGREPQFWDPVTGQTRDVVQEEQIQACGHSRESLDSHLLRMTGLVWPRPAYAAGVYGLHSAY